MAWRTAAFAAMLALAGQESPGPVTPTRVLAAAEASALAGRHPEAIDSLERLLREAGLSDEVRARALDALGASEIAVGRYEPAATHAAEAADRFGQLRDTARRSGSLNRVGLARLYAAEYTPAAAAFRAAAELSRARGDPAAEAEQVTNLGNVHFFLGRYSDAAAAYDTALVLTARTPDAAWASRRRRLTLVNLATLDQRLGRDRDALARYQQIDTTGADLRPREHAQILANLGVLYRRLGDPHKALETYARALDLFQTDQFLDGELGVIKNRGIVLALDLNDLDRAEVTFTRAVTRASEAGNRREVLQALIYRGETRRRLGRFSAASEDFRAGLTLARELRTPEEEWKALFGLGRVNHAAGRRDEAMAGFSDALGVIETIRERVRVPTLRSDFFSDKREVYDHLIDTLLDAGAPAARVLHVLEQSHSRAWRERLGLTSALNLADLQARLPPDTTVLDYWFSDLGAALVTVRRDAATLTRLDLSSADISALSRALSRPQSADSTQLAHRIGEKLLPAGVLDGATRVAIVSDGALGLVPFEVLAVAGRPLVERVAVSYLPTAAGLLAGRAPVDAWRAPWRPVLTAFADPLVPSTSLDASTGPWPRLTESVREVTGIAAETGGRSRLLTGPANQKAVLEAGLGDSPLLHLATHAAADGDALEQSRILFSPASTDPSRADYLYLREAYELPLDGVELAVLSACETSRGRLVRGEGVQSFSRAFLAAGARSTVTTLWRVPDGPTADFMRIFYRGLHDGLARDEALRRAKLEFLRSGTALADPHYWAAFVLSGDGASSVPRAPRIRTLAAGAALLLAAGVAVIAARRRRRR